MLPVFLLLVQGLAVAWRLPAFPVWFLCLLPQAKPGWVRVLEGEDVVVLVVVVDDALDPVEALLVDAGLEVVADPDVLVVEDVVAGIDVVLADDELEVMDDVDVPVDVILEEPVAVNAILWAAALTHIPWLATFGLCGLVAVQLLCATLETPEP